MAEQVVTITGVFTQQGNNARGPWTRYDVKDAGGNKYQTFDAELGAKAQAVQGQSVTLTFHEEARGQYTNNVLDGIKTSVNGATNAAPSVPSESQDDRQLRIMRQAGLERAILAASAIGIELSSVDDLYAISDQFVDYFVNGAPVVEDARL